MIHFSKSTLGFYDDAIVPKRHLPPDAVEVTEDQYTALMLAQAQGQIVGSDEEGSPIAVMPVATEQPASARWRVVQGRALRALEQSDAVAMRCLKAGKPYPKAWLSYDTALRAIVSAPSGDPAASLPDRPEYPVGT